MTTEPVRGGRLQAGKITFARIKEGCVTAEFVEMGKVEFGHIAVGCITVERF